MNANEQAPRVRPVIVGAIALAWAGALGTAFTILTPIATNPDAADVSVRLTGWSSPPLTILLVVLSVAFFLAGWRARRAEGLSAWQTFLVLPVIVGAVAAIAIPYSSLNNVAGPWQPRWGVRLLVASVLVGTLGYVLCAMTGRDGEREPGWSPVADTIRP